MRGDEEWRVSVLSSALTMEQHVCHSVIRQKIECRENPVEENFFKTPSPHPGADAESVLGQAGMSDHWWDGQGVRGSQGSQAQRGSLHRNHLS